MRAGLLRESALHRYALYCNVVRERLLIHFLNQSVNTQDLDSGGSALLTRFDSLLSVEVPAWNQTEWEVGDNILTADKSLVGNPLLSKSLR